MTFHSINVNLIFFMIGGDLLFNDCRYNIHANDYHTLMYPNKRGTDQISVFSAIMILICVGISNDPFYMSYSTQTGILQTIVICFSALILTQISFHIFVNTWRYDSSNSYVSIWTELYGKKTSIIPQIFLLIAFLSISSVSTSDYYDMYTDILSYFDKSSETIFSKKWFAKYIVCGLFTFPFMFFKKFTSMYLITTIGNLLLLISIICEGILFFRKFKEEGFDPQKELVIWNKDDFSLSVACFDLYNVLFFLHPFVSFISEDIRNATRSKIANITWMTTTISALLNLVGGILGYFTFFSSVQDDNIFYFYEDPSDYVVMIGKFCLMFKTLISNSMYVYIAAVQLIDMFVPYEHEYTESRFAAGVAVWLFNIFVTFNGYQWSDLMNLMGSFCFIILAFILPSIFYLSMYKFRRILWGIVAVLEVLICTLISGVILIYNIKSFKSEHPPSSFMQF